MGKTRVTVRLLEPGDVKEVEEIHRQYSDFPLPDLSNPLYICKGVALLNDEIVGVGLVRITSEAILILDKSRRKVVKGEALRELIKLGVMQTDLHGIDEWHTFITGDESGVYSNVLKNTFGFVECEGRPMFLRIGVSNG